MHQEQNIRGKYISNSFIRVITYILISAFILSEFSCITKRQVIKAPLKEQGETFLFEQLEKNSFEFNNLSAKLYVKLVNGKKSNSFNVNLKLKKDSVIWLSISPALGLEVARIIISKDSVKMINRLNSTYYKGSLDYISKMFKYDFTFELIQKLITGNPYLVYEHDFYKAFIDKEQYLLNTIGRGQLNRSEDFKKMVQKLWITPETFKISRVIYNDYKLNRKIEASYNNYESVSNKSFPSEQYFEIDTKRDDGTNQDLNKSRKQIKVFIEYSKINTEKPLNYPFNIPEEYELIK